MAGDLDELEATLHEGMKLSMQPSMGRRAPAAKAVPFLSKARTGLRRYAAAHPDEARAHRLLSLAEETMLGYGAAIAALARAIELGGGADKRDLKRLAMLREAAAEWSKLPLAPEQLRELGRFLEQKLGGEPGARSLRWTETWLHEQGLTDADAKKVLAALADRGGFSDMQVLYNVVRG